MNEQEKAAAAFEVDKVTETLRQLCEENDLSIVAIVERAVEDVGISTPLIYHVPHAVDDTLINDGNNNVDTITDAWCVRSSSLIVEMMQRSPTMAEIFSIAVNCYQEGRMDFGSEELPLIEQ